MFWASSYIFLSLSHSRLFTMRQAAGLGFLKEHPLICGLFYGAAVELVMSLIVLPLSALHARALTNCMT
ncbi:MAG TPA: hypothetical protein VFA74_13030 [Terriglobales bacterium]|nr:hypothetical protein [Terriglobales bacterium]